MRYLYTADGDELFAYAPGRRDFFRASDDTLWAHESHDWLVAAVSGEALAHRTGDVYYGAANGEVARCSGASCWVSWRSTRSVNPVPTWPA